jgi:hypothetical protein
MTSLVSSFALVMMTGNSAGERGLADSAQHLHAVHVPASADRAGSGRSAPRLIRSSASCPPAAQSTENPLRISRRDSMSRFAFVVVHDQQREHVSSGGAELMLQSTSVSG